MRWHTFLDTGDGFSTFRQLFPGEEHHGDHQGHHRCVKKRLSKEYRSLGLGLGDPLASLDQGEFLIDAVRTQCQLPNFRVAEWHGCFRSFLAVLKPAGAEKCFSSSASWMTNSWVRSGNTRVLEPLLPAGPQLGGSAFLDAIQNYLAILDAEQISRFFLATRWLSWYGVGLANADRLPVVVRIPAGPLGSLKCDPPKGNGRRPQKRSRFLVLQDNLGTDQKSFS